MKFDNDYSHSLDKKTDQKLNTSPNYLGISASPFKDQLEGLRTRIFQGASRVELGFTGRGKGSMAQGQTTPGMFGKDEREAMRQLAKINDVELSTHSTFSGGSLAGYNPQAGGFQNEAKESALQELKRAVDFAADTARGGPVVVHAEEFPRETVEHKEFETFPGEREKAPIMLADEVTGQITQLPRDSEITVLDPKYTKKENGVEIAELTDEGKYHWQTKTIGELETKDKLTPVEIYKQFVEKEIRQSEGEEKRWAQHAKQAQEQLKGLEENKKEYNNLMESGADEAAVKTLIATNLINSTAGIQPGGRIAQEIEKDPIAFIDEQVKEKKIDAESHESIAQSYGRRAFDVEQQIKRMKPIEEVGLKKTADTVSRAALEAYKKEKEMNLEKPLFIAPEALWNESGYGGHPDELKKIIVTSRQDMVEKLTEKEINGKSNDFYKGISKQQAETIAEDHIKATFDIGHANTWRKFFKAETGETIKQTDERFNKWLIKKVDDLQKEKLIGHVHIADNFGFQDEHTPPGEGTAPIPEFVKKLKETGYKGTMIVEPAHHDVQAWTKAMKNLQSPMYRVDATSQTWTDIEGSYFGRSASPSYVVGAYAPDATLSEEQRDWRFWSGTSIE